MLEWLLSAKVTAPSNLAAPYPHTSCLLILKTPHLHKIPPKPKKKKKKQEEEETHVCTEKETIILLRKNLVRERERDLVLGLRKKSRKKCQWHPQFRTSKSQTLHHHHHHHHLAPLYLPLHQPPRHLLTIGFLQQLSLIL
jgi:hypothetical protein